ncbi:1064_t:CDS:1 [Funneliformis caledonium]|uniref:1064_t:CDS:1 n=2 Tax=Funneliformis TaxID=1117308 RepID=A0A9N9H110_9GLOM|nr:15627_t:CDS:1 [Funneliformis mosseae]CAG8648824.1 1064_t:CDS:1 [Funneliformis caledonium]
MCPNNNKKPIESRKQIFFTDFIRYDSTYQTFDFKFTDESEALFDKKKCIKLWVTNYRVGIYCYIGGTKVTLENKNNKGKLQDDFCCFEGNNYEKSYGILRDKGKVDKFQMQDIKVKDSLLVKTLECLLKPKCCN